ncbi:MAG TPA: inositol monophosphatase family protein [Verrucomicrobiae bacterium]|nr:inositol monophosphatase family protein [Verrucomicrobiae bacterium]
MLQHTDLNVRTAWAEQQVRVAGRIMLEFAHSSQLGVRTKLNKTVVTEADTKINDMLIAAVAESFPDDGVLGEEASAHADRKLLWVFDPIDDTKGYILGLTTAMSSLALVEEGQPVVAAMYEPLLDKLFTAVKGGGAFENGRPIRVSEQQSLQGAQVAFSPSFDQVMQRQELYKSAVDAGIKLLPMNGEAFRGSLTANGMIDAHLFPGKSAHDVAAVKLIVEEAGGKVTNLRGEEQPYNAQIFGAIVSNGHLHQELVDLMKDFDPENYLGY